MPQASQLYCLCRTPYDGDRPMLSCDYCTDWFHYDCVGLAPPGERSVPLLLQKFSLQ